mmetsp:Transcript_25816/g.63243  ORF Transcript_25816/g.63243 Transcript_25816/m.63243 type:complete len:94 (+) Transcript_25816:1442-1723(+)
MPTLVNLDDSDGNPLPIEAENRQFQPNQGRTTSTTRAASFQNATNSITNPYRRVPQQPDSTDDDDSTMGTNKGDCAIGCVLTNVRYSTVKVGV